MCRVCVPREQTQITPHTIHTHTSSARIFRNKYSLGVRPGRKQAVSIREHIERPQFGVFTLHDASVRKPRRRDRERGSPSVLFVVRPVEGEGTHNNLHYWIICGG